MLTDADLPGAPQGAVIEERMIDVPGGRVHANVTNPAAPGTPVVGLHGGPGYPSYYLEPMRALADRRPVILLDQLGCGRSDRPADPALWTIERFADELEAVLAGFGYPAYHLFGHSWGTMLATRYVTRHGPGRVRSIVMGSPALQVDWWERDCNALVAAMPEEMRRAIEEGNASGDTEGPAYQAAHGEFYLRHVCKRGMETGLFARTVEECGYDVYMKIQGPNEFTVIGDMKGWDFRPELAALTVPVLYLTGAEDEARPTTVAAFATVTPGSRMVVIPDAAHLTMLDNAAAHNAEVARFLDEVDRAAA
ncbi:MAG: proline iminopeptidase-family hydrolase [Sphingomonas sp.]